MRTLSLNLIVAGLLLFGAASAHAFAINMSARGATTNLDVSDNVTVDIFLNAEPGLTLLSVAVLASNNAAIDYNGAASAALTRCPTCTGPGTSGAEPAYILYTGGKTSSILYPQQTPAWLNWPAPPVGKEQVNINYVEPSFKAAAASGTGIWIASMVFHISQAITNETLALSLTSGGNILQTGSVVIPPSAVALSAPITLTGAVPMPEPSTAMLLGLGVLGLCVAGRKRA